MPNWTKEQMDAINLDNSNIIVSAGAGSGKTAVLSERVIRKLKDGVHINELLILTFTNAAAKEMKDRIRKKIKKEGLTKELELLDSSYITTFDSYALSILKKYHYLLNINKDLSIVDSDLISYQKEKILEEIFDEYYVKQDELFLKFISDFSVKNDNELRKYILKLSSKLDLIVNLDEYFNVYETSHYSNEYLNKIIKEYENILLEKIDNIKLLLHNLSFYVDEDFNEKMNAVLVNLLNSNNYDDIKSYSAVKLPTLKTEYEEAKEYKKEIKKLTDDIKELTSFTKEEIKNQILLTKDYTNVIINIIKELNNRIMKFKNKYDLYEFNDIAKLSINLLKNNESIRNEIKESLNEIMIDEYQDTNDIQEEFISLISNNNVYMVGDIKQSIYRFRNANPYIFKNKYDSYSKNNGGIKIDLNKNFRSREETLNNINILFNLIMDDTIGGADYKYSHQMIFGNKTYNESGKTNQNNNFEIYNYDYDKDSLYTREEMEIFIIANDIKNKVNNKYQVFDKDKEILRDATYSDFVILLDRSKDFTLYKKIFEYNNIPLSILKDEKINDEVLLTVINSLITSLVKIKKREFDNEFKHSFTSLLRSFICEYDDETIFEMYLNNKFYDNDVYRKLKNISIENLTIKEILYLLIDEFDIINKLVKIGNIETNMYILEYLITYVNTKESIGYTINEFSEYLNEILESNYEIKFSSNKNQGDSVKIMTIHKSKGLEYHICYYAGLYNGFNIREMNDRFMFDNKYGIITPYYNEGVGETIYKTLIKNIYIKEEISEKIRLFYVALTRAKEKMIILADMNGEKYGTKDSNGVLDNIVRLNYRSFLDILISIKKELSSYIKEIKDVKVTKDYELIKKQNFSNSLKESNRVINIKEFESDNEIIEDTSFSKKHNKLITKEEKEKMDFGTNMHYLFEVNDFNNPKDELIKKFLNVYDISNVKDILKEYEFMYEKDNIIYHGIIDLMFIYDDHIDIIDYKLKNIEDEAYISQLNGYKEFIYLKTKKKINIYLYSIIDNIIKEL